MDNAEGMQSQNIEAPNAGVTDLQSAVAPQEKVLKQSEVNELVGRIKHEAYLKGQRDAQEATKNNVPSGMLTDEQLKQVNQLMEQKAHQDAQLQEVQNTLHNFASQMSAGKGKYSDFDETVAKLGDLKMIPHIVKYATDQGNAGDIMYELAKNPSKVASLTTLAYINPDLAKTEMRGLAESIRKNEAAKEVPEAPTPLSQVKHSNRVGMDSGTHTVSDLRKKSWARA